MLTLKDQTDLAVSGALSALAKELIALGTDDPCGFWKGCLIRALLDRSESILKQVAERVKL